MITNLILRVVWCLRSELNWNYGQVGERRWQLYSSSTKKTTHSHEGHWHLFWEKHSSASSHSLNYCESVTLSPRSFGWKIQIKLISDVFARKALCLTTHTDKISSIEKTLSSAQHFSTKLFHLKQFFQVYPTNIASSMLCGRWFMLANVCTLCARDEKEKYRKI